MEPHAERVARLRARLVELGEVAVAFSGGVDSSVLLHAAHEALGERTVGLIADSPSLPRRELADALSFAESIGARLDILSTDELEDPAYRANAGDRCYFCKAALFRSMEAYARAAGVRWLAFGEITDDRLDDRPGARAAAEFGVVAPLTEAGLGKEDVRRYAREHGLRVADKPASACLASRLPVGTPVTAERLARVERAEDLLHDLGLAQVRVRDHGAHTRVEVDAPDLDRARHLLPRFTPAFQALGFREVELAPYVRPAARLEP